MESTFYHRVKYKSMANISLSFYFFFLKRSLLCHIESELRDIKQQLSALEAQQNIPEVPELRCQSCAALRSALDGLMQRVDVIDAHLDNRPSISIRAVSAEREEELYRDCFMRGEHQPQVYAASMFMALAPFDAYQTWAKKVNWGGTNGKAELPRDLKEKVHSYVAQRFPDLSSDKWYKVRNSINERLRSPRKVDPERQRIF